MGAAAATAPECVRVIKPRRTVGASTAGAADPVNIVLNRERESVVDHKLQALDVETSGGHIGCDHALQLTRFEALEDLCSLILGEVAVNRS